MKTPFLVFLMTISGWVLSASQQPTGTPPVLAPTIVSFTCKQGVVMGYRLVSDFEWRVTHATRVSLQSGTLENGQFDAGTWYFKDDLPATGSAVFDMKINNYAGRLCVEDPPGQAVCAICDPFGAVATSTPTPPPAQAITFKGEHDLVINALFYRSARVPAPTVVLLNFRLSWEPWATRWRDRGFNVVAIDLLAYSGAPWGPETALTDIRDILRVIAQLQADPGVVPDRFAILGGSLMGGYAIVACAKSPVCRTAVLLSPTSYQADLADPITALGSRPVFIAASTREGDIITGTAQDYADRAAGPHRLILYEGGTHAEGLLTAHPELVDTIGDWLVTYLRDDTAATQPPRH